MLELKDVDLFFCGDCGFVLRGYAEDLEYMNPDLIHCICGVSKWQSMAKFQSWKADKLKREEKDG